MRKAAQEAQLEAKKKLPVTQPSSVNGHLAPTDALTLQALRNLSAVFEIDGADIEPYREALSKPASVEERSLAWQERRRLRE